MTSNLERIEYELKLAGFDLNKEEFDYGNECGKAAYEICQVFLNQGHSGYSAMATLQLIKKLLIDNDTLTPLTDNPDEWTNLAEYQDGKVTYQSKRKFSCFSEDLKAYYDIDELADDGSRIMHKLKHFEKV